MNRLTLLISTSIVVATATAAWAQAPELPSPKVEEVMVKTSLLTLNDANLTGNYAVMFARMAKPFRERFTPDTLKQAFRSFAGHHIDAIAAMSPARDGAPSISGNGVLSLRGAFDTTPSRLTYQLDFAVSENEWKLVAIDVKVKSSSTTASGAAELMSHVSADIAGSAR